MTGNNNSKSTRSIVILINSPKMAKYTVFGSGNLQDRTIPEKMFWNSEIFIPHLL